MRDLAGKDRTVTAKRRYPRLVRAAVLVMLAACATKAPTKPQMTAPGDLWKCTCSCDDRAGGPPFQPAVIGCAPIGLDDSVGADRDTACADICKPSAVLGSHEFAYIGPCTSPVLASDGFADGHITGPSSCDPTTPGIETLTDVAAYHATLDPSRSTMTLDAFDHIEGALGGRIAFDFEVPLEFNPQYIFFENVELLSQTDPAVQIFEANGVDVRYASGGALASTGVLPVRWRDTGGARGINPQSASGWTGQLDLSARSLVFDLKGVDPSDSSWTFTMHVEAVVDDLPPIADTGGDVTVPCASPSGTPVTLDASASTDPDPGDAVIRYQWLVFGGSPAISSNATTTINASVGSQWFELHAYDRQLGAAYLRKIVTVTSSASCP